MDHCDALIVGGGPAGSACAWRLIQAGMQVGILDKKTFPRDKICAGWITPAVAETLALDLETYSRHNVLQPIRAFRTGMINGPEVLTRYDETVSYGIRRCEFDHYLLQRSGARLWLGEPLTDLKRKDGGWQVNGRIHTPIVIGAGGHFCPVARELGAELGRSEQVVAAQEIEFKLSNAQMANMRIEADTPELYFCQDLKGYGWCFRKGDYLNIGLGREDNHQLSRHIDNFIAFLDQRKRISFSIPAHMKGHAYLLYRQRKPRRLYDNGILLIGDSAGLAYPQSGEGIRPAVESALIAAEVLINANGDYTRAQLAAYETQLVEQFGVRQHNSGKMKLIPKPLLPYIAATMLGSGWLTRHIVLNRWFLHVRQRPLNHSGSI